MMKSLFGVIAFYVLCALSLHTSNIRPVSVFPFTAPEYHRYAAILAATEPFRLQREVDVKRSLGMFKYFLHRLRGSDLYDPDTSVRKCHFLVNKACEAYEDKAREIISAYGLDSKTFQNISQFILNDPKLRQQVALQSYYYRIAADLEDNIVPIITHMPVASPRKAVSGMNMLRFMPSLSTGRSKSEDVDKADQYLVQRFSRSIVAIEIERKRRLDVLRNKVGAAGVVPAELWFSDPELLPLLAPDVRKAYTAFPKQAQRIVRQHGMSLEEFTYLLDNKIKMDSDFRSKVDAAIAEQKG